MEIEYLISEYDKIPPAAQVLSKLTHLLSDFNTGLYEVGNAISVDAALTASVVKLSNSAYYGAATKSRSLEEAMNRLGFKQIYRLVGMVISNQMGTMPFTAYGISSDVYFHSTVAAAITMEELAHRAGRDADNAHTLGLLYGVGKVVINAALVAERPDVICPMETDTPFDQASWERRHVGHDFTEIGVALLKKWNFAAEVFAPIEHQMKPLQANVSYRESACMLHCAVILGWLVADMTAGFGMRPGGITPDILPISHEILQGAGTGPKDLCALFPDVLERTRLATSSLATV